MAYVLVEKGEGEGKKLYFGPDPLVIGRLKNCDLTLKDPLSSRENTKLYERDERYWVEDLDSRNGTFLNGKKITGQKSLKDGDRVQVGQTIVKFVDPSAVKAPSSKSPVRRPASQDVRTKSAGRTSGGARSHSPKKKSMGPLVWVAWFAIVAVATKFAADRLLPMIFGN